MTREYWSCWDADAPETTGSSGTPDTSGSPDPEPEQEICHPRIDNIKIIPTMQIKVTFTRG